MDQTFTDSASGKDVQRPQLAAMVNFVRDGDIVVVHSMDRLARNLDDLRSIVRRLTAKGVRVQFVKEHLTFTGDDKEMLRVGHGAEATGQPFRHRVSRSIEGSVPTGPRCAPS